MRVLKDTRPTSQEQNKQIAISLSYNISPSSAFLPLLHDPGGKLREFYREPDVGNATLAQSKGRIPTLFIFKTLVVSIAATVALAEIVGYGRVAPIVKAHLEYTAVAIAVCRRRPSLTSLSRSSNPAAALALSLPALRPPPATSYRGVWSRFKAPTARSTPVIPPPPPQEWKGMQQLKGNKLNY